MIYTVTLNPALDKMLAVPALIPGTIHRAETLRYDLGGKGINVSRALRALDIPSTCFGFIAGHTGRILQADLQAQGYATRFIEIEGETRQNLTLLDRSKNEYTKINDAGPVITPENFDALAVHVAHTARAGDVWAFCGNTPPGAPAATYARLITLVQDAGARAFLDTSGAALQAGFRARPFALKINADEAGELLGRALSSDEQILDAVRDLLRAGITCAVITRGAQGIVLGMRGACVISIPPPVIVRSAVGAGDAAMAGLLWAILEHCDPGETARRVTACGTAAAMQEGSGVGDLSLIQSIIPRVNSSMHAVE